jgi:hypothetical protein
MSIRLIEFKVEDGKDMFLVEYPGKGQKWVPSFMIGGQYKEEKAALRYRYEQKNSAIAPSTGSAVDLSGNGDMPMDGQSSVQLKAHASAVSAADLKESLRCICQQQHAGNTEDTIVCSVCSKRSHSRCVRAEGFSSSEVTSWQCPFCRLLHMDPFNPGVELLMFTATPRNMLAPSSQEGTLTMRFNVLPTTLKEWQTGKMSVSVRCVGLGPYKSVPKGPLWPRDVTASVNAYKDVFKILPGKYGHVRREIASKEISDLVKPNSNSVSIQYKTELIQPSQQSQPPRFLFAVIVSAPKSKADILTMIKRPSLEECKQRDIGIVKTAQSVFDSLQTQELVIETKADFDILQTRCALSLCEMDTPVRGVDCEHIQCYDADAYIDVNIRTRNVEKRWHCPVCSKIVRPEDLIVDGFVLEGIGKAKQEAAVDEEDDGGYLKRLRLDTTLGAWEEMPDEDIEGEESDDENDSKRQKVDSADTVTEIVLDD